jgi:hypothetical protein
LGQVQAASTSVAAIKPKPNPSGLDEASPFRNNEKYIRQHWRLYRKADAL